MMSQSTFEESWKKVDPSIKKIEEISDKFSLGGYSQEDFKIYFKPKELMQVYTYYFEAISMGVVSPSGFSDSRAIERKQRCLQHVQSGPAQLQLGCLQEIRELHQHLPDQSDSLFPFKIITDFHFSFVVGRHDRLFTK